MTVVRPRPAASRLRCTREGMTLMPAPGGAQDGGRREIAVFNNRGAVAAGITCGACDRSCGRLLLMMTRRRCQRRRWSFGERGAATESPSDLVWRDGGAPGLSFTGTATQQRTDATSRPGYGFAPLFPPDLGRELYAGILQPATGANLYRDQTVPGTLKEMTLVAEPNRHSALGENRASYARRLVKRRGIVAEEPPSRCAPAG
jgi:hypothetical protein